MTPFWPWQAATAALLTLASFAGDSQLSGCAFSACASQIAPVNSFVQELAGAPATIPS
jgi:hypothetical protein